MAIMAKISFLCRVAGLSLGDRARGADIWRELGVELLLIQYPVHVFSYSG